MLVAELEPGEGEAPAAAVATPIRLEPRGERPDPIAFRQGAHPPFGIRWYGVTSLFGHLRNFTARLIATESVDTRDWMRPNAPAAILAASQKVLGLSAAPTLVEALGRPLWIDFAADTGDDRDVSAGVGRMLAATYDHGGRFLPRGDVLIFGGDIAYPVATADEIYKRLVLPWNEELRKVGASPRKKRLLLGVPGNHDWYDGLDGFGRLFRRNLEEPFRADDRDTTSPLGRRLRKRPGRKLGTAVRQLHLDEVGGLYGLFVAFGRSVRAFVRGVPVKRRRRLVIRGYVPVQEASYFILPLAPGLDIYGPDRQLGRVDFRQRAFFSKWRKAHPDRAVLFVSGDPALAYGLRNEPGAGMLKACRLALARDRILYLAGDFHHYERRTVGPSMHVIAGGGGAFLHGTRIAPYPAASGPPAVVYPDGGATRKLVAGVPLKLMFGRAGLLVHLAFALLAGIDLSAAHSSAAALVGTSVVIAFLLWLILYSIAHQGHHKRAIALVAAPFGAALGFVPMALLLAIPKVGGIALYATDGAVAVVTAFVSALLFGVYLSALAVWGLEHQQAFTVLGHPGYKHFVRLCVHEDGRIEAWTIGKDDVVAPGPGLLVDHFEWGGKGPDAR